MQIRSPLKLAIVTETYPPEINGVSKTIGTMVEGLLELGHQVSLYRPKQSKDDQAHNGGNLAVHPLPGLKIPVYKDLRFGFPVVGRLKKDWTQNPPDLVHVITEGPLGWAAVRASRQLKLPVISDFHTNFHSYSKYYRLGLFQKGIAAFLRKLHNDTQTTLVPTDQMKDELHDYGYRGIEVVGRGVDTQRFSPQRRNLELRESWGVTEDQLVVVYVGRIAPEKNIDLAVRAFEKIRDLRPDAKMVLVGDGPARKRLQVQFPNLIFAGMRTGTDLAEHYASGDVFFFPSITETFGNVVLEAMASGTPVLGYDYAAGRQYLEHGVSGMLAPYNDDAAYIQTALDLIVENRLAEMGQAARRVAESCTWNQIILDLERVYGSILSPNDGGRPCSTKGSKAQ